MEVCIEDGKSASYYLGFQIGRFQVHVGLGDSSNLDAAVIRRMVAI